MTRIQAHERFLMFFSLCLALYPIINRYPTIIPQITVAETIFFCFFIYSLLRDKGKIKINGFILAWIIYIFFEAIIAIDSSQTEKSQDIIWTSLRLIYVYFILMSIVPKYFNFTYFSRSISIIGTCISIYAIIQFALYYVGIPISTYIPFVPCSMTKNEIDMQILLQKSYGIVFRPRSLLTEPAALCIYLVVALLLELYREENNKWKYPKTVLFTIVCFISRSSIGIICVIIILLVYALKIQKGKINRSRLLIIGISTIMIGVIAWRSGIWEYFLFRTFQGDISLVGISANTRFQGLHQLSAYRDSVKVFLFGNGLAKTDEYLPGYARLFYGLGLVGTTIYILWMISLLWKNRHSIIKRKVTIYYLFLNIGSEILFGRFIMLYMPIMLNAIEIKKKRGT